MPLLVWITALCQEALAGPGGILRFTRFFRCRLPLRHRGGSPAGTGNGTGIGKFSPAFPARRRTRQRHGNGCSAGGARLRSEPRWAGGVAAGSAAHPCADDPARTSLSAPATPPAHRVFGALRGRRFVLDVGADSSATRCRRHGRRLHGFRTRSPMRMGSYRERQPTRVVTGLAAIPRAARRKKRKKGAADSAFWCRMRPKPRQRSRLNSDRPCMRVNTVCAVCRAVLSSWKRVIASA